MGDNIVTWQLHIARQKKKERNVFPVIWTSGIVWRVKLYDHNTQKQTSKETEINGWTDKRTSSVITPNIANEMKDYKLANLQLFIICNKNGMWDLSIFYDTRKTAQYRVQYNNQSASFMCTQFRG